MLAVIAVAFFAAGGGYLLRDSQDLEQEWAHCVDTAQGYDVEYPSNWHVSRGQAACSFFDPEPVKVPSAGEFPATGLVVETTQQSFDALVAALIDTRFNETKLREEVTIGGRRAFRLELVATGEGLEDAGTTAYGYVIRRANAGPVYVRTMAGPGERVRHRSVADHAALTLAPFRPSAAPDPTLPAAVEAKRRELLAAAETGDADAVAAVADRDEFSYTFGEAFPGGPAEYWRAEAGRGNDPLAALRAILRMPYTLATGHYVWPFAYDKTADTLTDYERGLLEPLETTFVGEGYLGWRAGIRPDGRWVFFVAGD